MQEVLKCHVGDPREEQDVVNLRTLEASESSVLEQATAAADTAVGDAITKHANILNRDIMTKSLNLNSQGTATKTFSMGGQYHTVLLGFQIQHLNTRLSISER